MRSTRRSWFTHPPSLESLSGVRRRIYGERLDGPALDSIVADVVAERYSDIHLAAFLTATSAMPMDEAETIHLTPPTPSPSPR
jgi:thymidine phosphorylase